MPTSPTSTKFGASPFGSAAPDKQRFKWTTFYEAMADKLLLFRDNSLRDIRLIALHSGDGLLMDSYNSSISENADDADNGHAHHQ
jgi:hypothetical protein